MKINVTESIMNCASYKPTTKEKIINWFHGLGSRYLVWSGYYKWDGEPLRCTKCDSWHPNDHEEIIWNTVNSHVAELELKCKLCGNTMGYWAYGCWEPFHHYVYQRSV